jgi:hypothetical protein
MKDAVTANVKAVKTWAAEVKKNPAALLRPPLPRTGNEDFDKKILGSIEDIARKTDPAYQINDALKGGLKDLFNKKPVPTRTGVDEDQKLNHAINQTRQESRAMGIDNATFRQIMTELETKNQGLFLNECGVNTSKVKSFGDGRFVICKSAAAKKAKKKVAAKPKIQKVYYASHNKPQGGKMASGTVGYCPSCIIEDLSVGGASDRYSAENFYRMAGIKHYSGNNLSGKQITRR